MASDNNHLSNNPPDDKDYNYSRVLDVHIWSDYPEVNDFINLIYDAYFSNQNGKKSIAKKHIKVVLLDLYLAWLDDPELCVAVNMTRNHYSENFGKPSRYNELNLSAKTIKVVSTLRDAGLIGYKQGFEAQEGYSGGRISRIWTEPKLAYMFQRSALSEFMAYSTDDREALVLKDDDKSEIHCDPTDETVAQTLVVKQYNNLLERTFIDIPSAESPLLKIEKKKGSNKPDKDHHVRIRHQDKFTFRVFNNGSFTESGRFYGGFWQRIGQSYRNQILINDLPTVEIDFSSFHPVLAYAKAGVSYWEEYKISPYDIPVDGINDSSIAEKAIKKLFLLALNAKTNSELFNAFRKEFDYSLLNDLDFKFSNDVLGKMLDSIKERHPIIADEIANGAGTKLMNLDSKIAEFVIQHFLETDTPILCIHDSFIVQESQRDRLNQAMKDAFSSVTEQSGIKYKQNLPIRQDFVLWRQMDRDYYLDGMLDKGPKRTTGYLNRLNKHNKFFNPKSTKSKSVQYTPDEIVMPKNYKKYQKDRGEPITDSKVWSGLFGGKSE